MQNDLVRREFVVWFRGMDKPVEVTAISHTAARRQAIAETGRRMADIHYCGCMRKFVVYFHDNNPVEVMATSQADAKRQAAAQEGRNAKDYCRCYPKR